MRNKFTLNEIGKGVPGSYLWRQKHGYSFGRSAVQGHGQCLSSTMYLNTYESFTVCVGVFSTVLAH